MASQAQAEAIVAWQRSARFGLSGGGFQTTRLGAVETSTPAVLSPPARPLWYPYLSTQAKQEVDAFIQKHRDRPVLVLFGSKDGPLHAVRNRPDDIANASNGAEDLGLAFRPGWPPGWAPTRPAAPPPRSSTARRRWPTCAWPTASCTRSPSRRAATARASCSPST